MIGCFAKFTLVTLQFNLRKQFRSCIQISLTFSSTQPNFMPEFQGGSYNPWGGPQGGCPTDIGADYANMYYRDLIYQRVSAISLYMLFGGTSWGWIAAPVVATSYDYSSPISENRIIGNKYYETKLLTQFTRGMSKSSLC